MSGAGEVLEPGLDIRPQLNHADVRRLTSRLYGLNDITITDLNAYDDKNFHLQVRNEARNTDTWKHGYVLKVINSLDSKKPQIIEAQNDILIFLGKKGIICPQPIKNIHGKYYSVERIQDHDSPSDDIKRDKEHIVRLQTFQPGEILMKVECTPELMYEAGQYVANLDKLLKDFHHPALENHRHTWMLEAAPLIKKFIYAVKDDAKRSLVIEVVDAFEHEVVPKINTLEKGLLHGDFNEQNILVQESTSRKGKWHIYGILDFGDSYVSCYLFELAITVCYMMLQSKMHDPLDAGGYVIAGYTTKRTLPQEEIQLLKVCVCARFAQSLVLGAYSHLQDPDNTYVLTTAVSGWSLLQKLWETPDPELIDHWHQLAGSYTTDLQSQR